MNSKSSKLWDRRWKRDLFFGFTLIGCFFIYRYEWMLSFPPSGPHTWRQADCVSITDNYYSHGMRFFWPEIHYQISDGDSSGYTAGEFPGLYYFNAALWKIFGKHLGISRFVSNTGLIFLRMYRHSALPWSDGISSAVSITRTMIGRLSTWHCSSCLQVFSRFLRSFSLLSFHQFGCWNVSDCDLAQKDTEPLSAHFGSWHC